MASIVISRADFLINALSFKVLCACGRKGREGRSSSESDSGKSTPRSSLKIINQSCTKKKQNKKKTAKKIKTSKKNQINRNSKPTFRISLGLLTLLQLPSRQSFQKHFFSLCLITSRSFHSIFQTRLKLNISFENRVQDALGTKTFVKGEMVEIMI